MKLVIVESPAKCKKIESFLGPGYICKASYGHIRDLKKKSLSIDVDDNFAPEYAILTDKKKVIAELKKASKKVDEVIIASDLDREGEAIGYHIIKVLGLDLKTTKRIVFNSITKTAIKKAIQKPRTIDTNLVAAQQARRILDRLVGFILSPLLWKHFKVYCLSAGRCQTVALRLLCEREEIIKQFKTESYYSVFGEFKSKKRKRKSVPSYLLFGRLLTNFDTNKQVVKFLKDCLNSTFTIKSSKSKRSEQSPPVPFITSTIQQTASNLFGFSPKKTMMVAQKLYEKGHITYMRTDSYNLSISAIYEIKDLILNSKRLGREYYEKRIFNKKSANSQEAHEAIRPTKNIKKTN